MGQGAPRLVWVNQFAAAPDHSSGTRHFDFARALVDRGWRVTLVASDFHAHSRRYTRRSPAERAPITETICGVDYVWLWAAPYQENDWRRARNWLSFAYAVAELDRVTALRADVVIGSSPQPLAAVGAWRLARRLGAGFVVEIRDLWPESLVAAGGRRGVGYLLIGAVTRFLYRAADGLLVLAEGTAEHLRRGSAARKPVRVIPNGVSRRMFDEATAIPASRSSRLRLVYAGAHGPANGLDVVLDCAARLSQDAEFLLVGDGPDKERLVRRVREERIENVAFRVPVSRSEVGAILRSCDAALMVLRRSDLFTYGVSPNKLLDYMASGLPVITNVQGEVAEIVRTSGGGLAAGDWGPEALSHAILEMRGRSPEDRRAMGAAARSWIRRNRTVEVLAEDLDSWLGRWRGAAKG